MPSNVIEIIDGTAREPKLRLRTTPPCDKYIALSYCWGGDQSFKATKSTIDDFTRCINHSDLPRTLQDAITVTLELGCRFLWVDVLCIIQDDKVHTAKEIAMMPRIYENAYATVIAARSKSCDEGFLQDITTPTPSSDIFRFPLCGDNLTSGSILCFDQNSLKMDPIEERAWPLQEFLLSRRLIRFGHHQVTWICRQSWKTTREDETLNWFLRREQEKVDMKTEFYEGSMDLFTWDKLIWNYTGRDLSDQHDRLLAISGIASKLAEKSQDAYIAGMWYSHLPRALLWEMASSTSSGRPSPYRAPTWAWTSVDGKISFGMGMNTMEDPDFRILSIDSEPTQRSARYGNLNHASITVRGWIRKLYWTDSSSTLLELDQLGSLEDDKRDTLALTIPDVSDDEKHDMLPVWCLQICSHDLNDGPYGLILTEKEEKVFERRGVFQFSSLIHERWPAPLRDTRLEKMRSWKSFCDLQTVVLI